MYSVVLTCHLVDVFVTVTRPSSVAEDAVLRMVHLLGAELFTVEVQPGQSI